MRMEYIVMMASAANKVPSTPTIAYFRRIYLLGRKASFIKPSRMGREDPVLFGRRLDPRPSHGYWPARRAKTHLIVRSLLESLAWLFRLTRRKRASQRPVHSLALAQY